MFWWSKHKPKDQQDLKEMDFELKLAKKTSSSEEELDQIRDDYHRNLREYVGDHPEDKDLVKKMAKEEDESFLQKLLRRKWLLFKQEKTFA